MKKGSSTFLKFFQPKTLARKRFLNFERVGGIEPPSRPWKGRIKAIILYPQYSIFSLSQAALYPSSNSSVKIYTKIGITVASYGNMSSSIRQHSFLFSGFVISIINLSLLKIPYGKFSFSGPIVQALFYIVIWI